MLTPTPDNRPTVIVCVPGIRQDPEGIDDWCDVVRDRIHVANPGRYTVLTYEYRENGLRKQADRERRAADIAKLVARYPGWRVVLVGHSNGCHDICEALKKFQTLSVDTVVLFAAATAANFDDNGLNDAARELRVRRIVVLWSPKDTVLDQAARFTRWVGSWIGFGYGELGLVGPKNVRGPAQAVTTDYKREYAHGEWLWDPNVGEAIGFITGAA